MGSDDVLDGCAVVVAVFVINLTEGDGNGTFQVCETCYERITPLLELIVCFNVEHSVVSLVGKEADKGNRLASEGITPTCEAIGVVALSS